MSDGAEWRYARDSAPEIDRIDDEFDPDHLRGRPDDDDEENR